MKWLINFLTSSIGKKLIMSLTGLFLIQFLVVHLIGNIQLLNGDDGQSFNVYADFMTSNPLIKFISFGLYAFILLHAIQGILLYLKNKSAKGVGYKAKTGKSSSWESRNMFWLGILLLVFLGIHMGDFWYNMKIDNLGMKTYEGVEVKDLYTKVKTSFAQLPIVIIYIVSMIGLGFHLKHGFWSAFQTLGLNHRKYTPIIQGLGLAIAILLPIAFAAIPILMYLGITL